MEEKGAKITFSLERIRKDKSQEAQNLICLRLSVISESLTISGGVGTCCFISPIKVNQDFIKNFIRYFSKTIWIRQSHFSKNFSLHKIVCIQVNNVQFLLLSFWNDRRKMSGFGHVWAVKGNTILTPTLKSKEELWHPTCKCGRMHLSLLSESPYLTRSGENEWERILSLSGEQNMLTQKNERGEERYWKHSNKLKQAIKRDAVAISVFACSRAPCVSKFCSPRKVGSWKEKISWRFSERRRLRMLKGGGTTA